MLSPLDNKGTIILLCRVHTARSRKRSRHNSLRFVKFYHTIYTRIWFNIQEKLKGRLFHIHMNNLSV